MTVYNTPGRGHQLIIGTVFNKQQEDAYFLRLICPPTQVKK